MRVLSKCIKTTFSNNHSINLYMFYILTDIINSYLLIVNSEMHAKSI